MQFEEKLHSFCQSIFDNHKDFINTYDLIFQLVTNDIAQIHEIYLQIKNVLIEKYRIPVVKVLKDISFVSKYRYCYLKSYWNLFQLIYKEYHQKIREEHLGDLFLTLLNTSNSDDFDKLINIIPQGSIWETIMNNDFNKFIRDSDTIKNIYEEKIYIKELGFINLLEACCYFGSVECFKYLRSEFNFPTTAKCTTYSFISGKPEIINECIKINRPDAESLEYAVVSHHFDFVSFLVNNYRYTLNLTTISSAMDLRSLFLAAEKTGVHDILLCCAAFNIPEVVEFFIENGAEINVKDLNYSMTPLHIAATYNYYNIVQILIKHGADVNSLDYINKTPLNYAAEKNSIETVRILIEHHAKINGDAFSPLSDAAINNSVESAEVLLKYGADPNIKDDNIETPLHFAAKSNSIEIVSILVNHGSNINASNIDGWTPLHHAYYIKSDEMIQTLIENGSDTNIKDKNGQIPSEIEPPMFSSEYLEENSE